MEVRWTVLAVCLVLGAHARLHYIPPHNKHHSHSSYHHHHDRIQQQEIDLFRALPAASLSESEHELSPSSKRLSEALESQITTYEWFGSQAKSCVGVPLMQSAVNRLQFNQTEKDVQGLLVIETLYELQHCMIEWQTEVTSLQKQSLAASNNQYSNFDNSNVNVYETWSSTISLRWLYLDITRTMYSLQEHQTGQDLKEKIMPIAFLTLYALLQAFQAKLQAWSLRFHQNMHSNLASIHQYIHVCEYHVLQLELYFELLDNEYVREHMLHVTTEQQEATLDAVMANLALSGSFYQALLARAETYEQHLEHHHHQQQQQQHDAQGGHHFQGNHRPRHI